MKCIWFSKAFLWGFVCLCLMSSYLELELGSSICLLNKELLSNSHTEAECSRGCHGPPTSKTDKIPQALRMECAPPAGGGSQQCLKRPGRTPSLHTVAGGCALSQGLAHTFLFEVQG
ncbi:unnamed protein product [Rangifer tarandus platyrhynchus]|uniref:Uncharacterized protein n=2 Tax=Rangifer tarandus platyrhynchus TaxID=3082113 RepID=A0AC59YEE9_RANTA|nr:unnamed protein product [Rangifer tarandus platyrhynchus]